MSNINNTMTLEIENHVTFASSNILHHSVISVQDLNDIVNELHSIYNHKQLLFSTSKNLLKYYHVIKTKVSMVNEKIMFSLDFPLVHPDIFQHYHLFSIPNKNQSLIIPPSTYLSLSNNVYQYSNEECIDLQPDFLCKSTNILPLQKDQECITSILSDEATASNCHQVPAKITQQIIFEINQAHYIGILPKEQKIQTICKQNTITALQGTYLFVIPPNCSLKVSYYTYTNNLKTIPGHPINLEKIILRNITTTQIEKIKLDKISLDKLHQIQLEKIEELSINLNNPHTHYSIGLTIVVIILSIVMVTYVLIKFKSKMFQKNQNIPNRRVVNETQVIPP